MRSPVGELVAAAGRAFSRPRNDPRVPYVAQADTRFSLGGFVPGATGDASAALEAPGGNGTLFAIINRLATATAAVDWHMHEKLRAGADATCDLCGGAEDAPRGVTLLPMDEHPAGVVWTTPNNFFTSMLLVETFEQHVDLVGEGWLVVGYAMGKPIELWPVRPDRMAPVRDPKKFISGYVYRSPDGTMVPLKLNEVISARTPAPWDPYRGAGAAQTLINQLYGARYAAEWNKRFFENSAIPGGVVEMPVHLGPTEWAELQARWAESHRGVSNAHTVAVLEHGAKWVDTKYTQRDMEFVELTRATREQIREAFGIHGHALGLSENVNRADAEAGKASFAEWMTVPRVERIKDMLNGPYLRLFGPQEAKRVEFAYTNPVPEDREADNAELTAKATAFSTLVTAGVHQDDAADVCGLPRMRFEKPEPKIVAAPPAGKPKPGSGD